MQKELIVVFLVLLVPVAFVILMGLNHSGAVVNELGELKKARVELYLGFPVPYEPLHRQLSDNVREYLRAGAGSDFYYADRLKFGNEFFENEKVLVANLLHLVCLKPVGDVPKGRFVTAGGMDVIMLQNKFFDVTYDEIASVPCDEELASSSENVLKSVLSLDLQLVQSTVKVSRCPEYASDSLKSAQENVDYGNFEAVLNDLSAAWRKATDCSSDFVRTG